MTPEGAAVVVDTAFLGPVSRVRGSMVGGAHVVAQMSGARARRLTPGTRVDVRVDPVPVLVVST